MLTRSVTVCILLGTILAGTSVRAQDRERTQLAAATVEGDPASSSDLSPRNQNDLHETLSILFKRAVGFHKAGNLEMAANEYRKLLEIQPNLPEVLNNFGMIYHALGDSASSRKKFEEALDLAPGYDAALNNLASLFYEGGEYSRARDLWLKAIENNPLDSEYRFNLALSYLKTEEPEKSIIAIKKAITLNPKYESAYEVLGETLLGQGDFEGSLKAYLSYLDCKPDPATTVSTYIQHQVAELRAYLGVLHGQD